MERRTTRRTVGPREWSITVRPRHPNDPCEFGRTVTNQRKGSMP
jgi:hypothetical protein